MKFVSHKPHNFHTILLTKLLNIHFSVGLGKKLPWLFRLLSSSSEGKLRISAPVHISIHTWLQIRGYRTPNAENLHSKNKKCTQNADKLLCTMHMQEIGKRVLEKCLKWRFCFWEDWKSAILVQFLLDVEFPALRICIQLRTDLMKPSRSRTEIKIKYLSNHWFYVVHLDWQSSWQKSGFPK